jgi:transcriptional regulator with XRE-family HTH domain
MPSVIPSPLGQHIRSKRKELGISIREMAGLIGKSPTFVVLLETDATPPSTTDELLTAVAGALDLHVDELFALARKVPEDVRPQSEIEVALFRQVQKLDPEAKAKLLGQLRRQDP